jgi:hypothetical protein
MLLFANVSVHIDAATIYDSYAIPIAGLRVRPQQAFFALVLEDRILNEIRDFSLVGSS